MTVTRPTPVRPSLRHRRPVRQPNKYVGPIIMVGILALVLQLMWMNRHWGELTRQEYTAFDASLIDKLKAKIIHLYECEYCRGNGLLDDPDEPGERILCEICWGVGYHATRRYTEGDRMCLACGGMGRRYDDHEHAVPCTRCEGRGITELLE